MDATWAVVAAQIRAFQTRKRLGFGPAFSYGRVNGSAQTSRTVGPSDRRFLRLFALLALLSGLAVFAQTYQPKVIRLEGADALDRAEVLHLVNLPQGTSLSKQQIEAAMQRLADSGLFSDLSYTVGPDALTITVKPIAGAGALPVRYSNFVWWSPGELELLVEARVPLFHGKLPLTGQLEAALASLLVEKA